MADFEWPTKGVRARIQITLAGYYLSLYSQYVGDESGLNAPAGDIAEMTHEIADSVEPGGGTAAEMRVLEGMQEVVHEAERTNGASFREFATPERTEWAVFCIGASEAVTDAVGDPTSMTLDTLEEVLEAGIDWLDWKSSPPTEATTSEWQDLRDRLPPSVAYDLDRSDVPLFGDSDDAGPGRDDRRDALSTPDRDAGTLSDDSGSAPDPTSHDFAAHVDPLSVRDKAVEVASNYPATGSDPTLQQICALHRFVRDEISYVSDPRDANYVAPPAKTLEIGGGDCDDQGVLLASLCEAIGASTRLAVVVSATGGGHLFPEVRMGDSANTSISGLQTGIASYYDAFVTNVMHTEDGFGGVWVPADPTMGQYLGDPSGYQQENYIVNGQWNQVQYHQP